MQEENLKIVHPLVTFLENAEGWYVEKTHGNQYQEGFPDLLCMHRRYGERWVECKVIRNGSFEFTSAQKRKFPKWITHGARLWLIAGVDFRGSTGLISLKKAYGLLFKEPNLAFHLNPETRRMMLNGL